jgi:hypothetical protein
MRKMLLWTATSIFAAGLSASANAQSVDRQIFAALDKTASTKS